MGTHIDDRPHVLIMGLGVSGLSAAELALIHDYAVTVVDSNAGPELEANAQRLVNRGAEVFLDWNAESWDKPVQLAVISPGIAPESALGMLAERLTCPVVSEVEFAYGFCSCPILAVTGTNGKTTTVDLTVHCLNGSGKRALAAGNIGIPLSEAVRKSASLDALVVEVSSFQLERVRTFTPYAAVLLNVTEDHLDRYSDFNDYIMTKLTMFTNMRQDKFTAMKFEFYEQISGRPEMTALLPGRPATFTSAPGNSAADFTADAGGALCGRQDGGGYEQLLAGDELKIKGRHNMENAMAALFLCRSVGVPDHMSVPLLRSFVPAPHRLELVTVRDGIKYIDDSKSTNPDALVQALLTIEDTELTDGARVILIAGGRDKQMDFRPVVPAIKRVVREISLIGETKEAMADLWRPAASCKTFASLDAAVDSAIESAQPQDVVLLSPGCSSQDMFIDYADRGNRFAQEVKRRLGE